jgi:hypothetical protein
MDPLVTIRNELREAFDYYSAEAQQMHRLLLRLVDDTPEQRHIAVEAQQTKLNAAKARYERAQEQYVKKVLGGLAGAGGASI